MLMWRCAAADSAAGVSVSVQEALACGALVQALLDRSAPGAVLSIVNPGDGESQARSTLMHEYCPAGKGHECAMCNSGMVGKGVWVGGA